MTKDVLTLATVCFEPVWGDKEANLNRMIGYAECAAKRGADFVLFPETALTGYDLDPDKSGADQMHHRLAEPIPGPSSEAMAKIARELGIYVAFGLAERAEDGAVYNAAAVVAPDGSVIGGYRKMHLPATEPLWAARGSEPLMFDTPWGKIGIAICYDTFVFNEIMRFYRANGCRLHLNPCAVDSSVTAHNVKDAIEYQAANNAMYIASANCTGCHRVNDFVGGANIVGPGKNVPEVHYYAGRPFGEENNDEQEMYVGTIDLSYTAKPFLAKLWDKDDPDFRPDVYVTMYEKLLGLPQYRSGRS